jgi:O-succinylbenzoic acid--CoA ligase
MVFFLNDKSYSISDLRTGAYQANTSFEKSTLDFCNDWLNEKKYFEIRTSGSTGAPKKISFARKQLEASAELTADALQLKKDFNALICLDTKYIAGQMMLVRSFVTGMNIIAIESSANPFDAISKELKIDFVALVPYQVQAILNSTHSSRFNSIRKIIIGGAPLNTDVIKQLQSYSCAFFATYGMTETISHIGLQKLNGKDRQTHFHPLRSIKLEKNERGCLVIHAPHVSKEKIVTNDLVELSNDQSFKIIGRWDNIINTGGVKISPEAVEEKIKKIFDELQLAYRFFVSGLPDEKLGTKVVLIIEGDPFTFDQQNSLERALKAQLAKYEIPKETKFVSDFIETETLKINRKETIKLL